MPSMVYHREVLTFIGPLLFLIFINDLQNCSDLGKFVIFADDNPLSSGKVNNSQNTVSFDKHCFLAQS